MVCDKCSKKLKALAVTDVWKGKGEAARASTSKGGAPGSSWKEFSTSTTESRDQRVVGENKLLASKKKMRFEPYMKKDMLKGKDGLKKMAKCEKCASTLPEPEYRLCQACAYPKGLCAMCTKPVMDTTGCAPFSNIVSSRIIESWMKLSNVLQVTIRFDLFGSPMLPDDRLVHSGNVVVALHALRRHGKRPIAPGNRTVRKR